jgi:hypothetical protein
MPSFPYTELQIEEMVKAEKQPVHWNPWEFEALGGESLRLTRDLIRTDGKSDRIRLIIRVLNKKDILTCKASLLLEDIRVRGIDYHELAQRRFYKEIIPAGWHEDIVNPNLEKDEKGEHIRLALENFAPYHIRDFVKKICRRWNILMPGTEDTLI